MNDEPRSGQGPGPTELLASADLPDGFEFSATDGHARSTWTIRATRDHDDAGSGRFVAPRVFVSIDVAALPASTEFVGYAFTQFAMPVSGGPNRKFDFSPAPNLRSPSAVVPLVMRTPDGRVILLAPLDGWHEQIIVVDQDDTTVDEFRWGLHGDLMQVPEDFSVTLGIFTGDSASEVFRAWGDEILDARATTRPDRSENPFTSMLSYWTDNGAAYWYRTEPGRTLVETLAAKRAELEEIGVVIGAWEMDSWFYEHEISRPVTEVGYLEDVPPTGMMTWEPRADILPDGMGPLIDAIDGLPLGLHARHISPQSPYLADGDWWTDKAAHPVDPGFFRRWFRDAAEWGTAAIEQDWMLLYWFGVRQLREAPHRALEWQRAIDRMAGEFDIGLIWCMATPGDMMATVELDQVIAVRTSDDYRFAEDAAVLWRWYLSVNRLVDSLDLATFKDCFFTMTPTSGTYPGSSPIDGDEHAEVEALLSAFSGGIAGIGDRLGRTDPDIVSRLCEPDGRLVQPDRPITLADQSFFAGPDAAELTWAHTHSTHNGRTWHYVVALHAAVTEATISDRFELAGHDDWVVYDWRTGAMTTGRQVEAALDHRDWALYVFCPIEVDADGSRHATIGDVRRYATMGHVRLGEANASDDRPMLHWSESA